METIQKNDDISLSIEAKKAGDNAKRFINAYNKIDHALRAQYNFKRGQSFGDMVRRCTAINSIVRKYEDILIDFSRLRNAIIHNGNDEFVIAEPHEDVTLKMEKIAELISKPPLVINTVCRKDLIICNGDESVANVLAKMYESGYSNIPVYKNNRFEGMANAQKLINTIGEICYMGKSMDELLKTTTILDAINYQKSTSVYYELVSADITIDQALNKFFANRKLLALLITKNGEPDQAAIGIVTVGDIMDINMIMDNYK